MLSRTINLGQLQTVISPLFERLSEEQTLNTGVTGEHGVGLGRALVFPRCAKYFSSPLLTFTCPLV
jgi:hypothetical protein